MTRRAAKLGSREAAVPYHPTGNSNKIWIQNSSLIFPPVPLPPPLSLVSHAQRDRARSEGELDRRHLQQCRLFAFLRVARAVRSYAVTQVRTQLTRGEKRRRRRGAEEVSEPTSSVQTSPRASAVASGPSALPLCCAVLCCGVLCWT